MTIRFGLAGTGHWARAVHAPGLARTPGATPVGVWGRNAAGAKAIADAHGLAVYRDFDAMLAEVDAVSFALPPDVQAPLALRAAQAGKHLLLEKPLARHGEAARAIAREVAARELSSVVFFMRRFVPEIAAAIDAAASRRWTRATVTVDSPTFAPGSPYLGSAWRHEGGAALWDVGPHVLSILVPVLGPVVDASAGPGEGTDVAFTTHHASGAMASVTLTLHDSPERARNDYVFHADDASLWLPAPSLDRPGLLAIAAGDLVGNIVRGTPRHPCDAAFGASIVEVLESVAHRAGVMT